MIRLSWHRRLFCILAGGSVGFSGCAVMLPPYPVHPANSYATRISQGAVDIAIHPITDGAESKRYFGVNLVSRNVLATLVVVDNHSTSSVVLDAAQCELVGVSDRADDDQLPGKAAGEVLGVLSTATISLAGGVLAMKMMMDSDNLKYNLHVKELGRQTVSPGKSAQGFLYFRIPDRRSSKEAPSRWQVNVAVSNLGVAATSHTSLVFDWER